MSDLKSWIESYFNYPIHDEFRKNFVKRNYYSNPNLKEIEQAGRKNTYAHAYMSAKLAQENNDYIATDSREFA